MAENLSTRMLPQPDWVSQVLGLLRSLTLVEGATLSIYTSRKGRVWVTFKSHTPHTYSSSAEAEPGADTLALLRAVGCAGWHHLSAVNGYVPRQDGWLTLRDVDDTWDDIQHVLVTGELASSPPVVEEAPITIEAMQPAIRVEQFSAPVAPDLDTPSSTEGKAPRSKGAKK